MAKPESWVTQMQNTRKSCDLAAKLLDIENRLHTKAQSASSDFAIAGYAQASLEIARETRDHLTQCSLCRAIEVQEAA